MRTAKRWPATTLTLQDTRADEFTFRDLKLLLSGLAENTKILNNVASMFSMALEYGHLAQLIPEPLHLQIAMRKHQKPQPDPFPLEHVEVILQHFSSAQARDYYEFAFFSGMRPSEQIALR